MYFVYLVLCLFFIVGCSTSSEKAVAPEKNVAAANNETGVIANLQAKNSKKVSYNPNELISKISESIAQNPDSSLKAVVTQANELKSELGYPFALVASSAELIGSETFIVTESGERLNVGFGSEPLCATGIAVTYPVIKMGKSIWTIKYNGTTYKIKANAVNSGEVKRNSDNKTVTRLSLPDEGSSPGGITSNGNRALVRFDLNPSTSSWWQRIMKKNPKEVKPFLVLLVSEDDFEFSDDREDYDSFDESPPKESDDETTSLKFEDSKFYFKSVNCG